jgi:hypothetical protein
VKANESSGITKFNFDARKQKFREEDRIDGDALRLLAQKSESPVYARETILLRLPELRRAQEV